jgi:hypothetical protein
VTSFTNTLGNSGDVYWQATGTGSVLRFPKLTTVNNGTGHYQDVYLQALQGGQLDLSSVTDIVDPNSAEQRARSIRVKAEGVGSTVKLNSLQNFVDYHAGTTTDDDNWEAEYSWLQATQNGTIELGALTTVRGVYLPLDGSGTVDTSTIVDLRESRVEVSNRAADFHAVRDAYSTDFILVAWAADLDNLLSANQATFQVESVNIVLPQLATIDAASFAASGGASIVLPAVKQYTIGSQTYLRADGAGSTLVLPTLTSIVGPAGTTKPALDGLNGGRVAINAQDVPISKTGVILGQAATLTIAGSLQVNGDAFISRGAVSVLAAAS